MPPIDPGASIQWAKNPRYAESLLTAISHLPQYEFDVVMVCNPAKTLSKLEQNRRKASIAQLTRRVFTTQTDTRWKTYEGSVMRKTQSICKDYKQARQALSDDRSPEMNDVIRARYPWWDTAHAILVETPEFQPILRRQAQADAAPAPVAAGSDRDDMSEVEYYGDRDRGADVAQWPGVHDPEVDADTRRFAQQNRRMDLGWIASDQDNAHAGAVAPLPNPAPPAVQPPPIFANNQWAQMWMEGGGDHAAALANVDNPYPPPQPRPPVAPHVAAHYAAEARHQADAAARATSPQHMPALRARTQNTSSPRRRAAASRQPEPAQDPLQQPQSRAGSAADHWPSPRAYENEEWNEDEDEDRNDYDDARVVVRGSNTNAIDQGNDLDTCPVCNARLEQATSANHLRRCLEGDDVGATVLECPICVADLRLLTSNERERHIDECCTGATRGTTDAGGKGKERAREYAAFTSDEKTLPRDSSTREPLECGVCMDDFEVGISLVRLSCYCVFHESCMVTYWTRPGTFCPVHRDDRITTVDVQMH